MIVKMTSKRQVTFPKRVCDAMGIKPGVRLELIKKNNESDWRLRLLQLDEAKLAPLKDKIHRNAEPFNIRKFRSNPSNYARLRD